MKGRPGTIAALILVLLGFLQMLGWATGSAALRGAGFALTASPLPMVFSHMRGAEPFSAAYAVTYDTGSERKTLDITPKLYEKLKGPYNLRNTYGAAFAFGPVAHGGHERELWESVITFGMCRKGPVARQFGVKEAIERLSIHVTPSAKGRPITNMILECPP